MGFKILSLFGGCEIACQAVKNVGINVSSYYSSETDKYAIKIALKNHPEIIQLGDIRGINLPYFKNERIDLIIAGSPCQGFSFAGKQLNFKDERSKLFFDFVRVLRYIKPKYFILENVSMKKEYRETITRYVGVRPVMINSALVSAQNRKRLYWTNIPDVQQPANKGLLLKSIIENGYVDRDKSYCIDANYHKGGSLKDYLKKKRRQIVFKSKVGLPQMLTETRTEEAKEARRAYRKKYGKDFSPRRGKHLIPRTDSKANCITTSLSQESLVMLENYHVRKLTVKECERAQTLPDGYTEGVSNTQRYKMIGNGFTCAVIEGLLKQMIKHEKGELGMGVLERLIAVLLEKANRWLAKSERDLGLTQKEDPVSKGADADRVQQDTTKQEEKSIIPESLIPAGRETAVVPDGIPDGFRAVDWGSCTREEFNTETEKNMDRPLILRELSKRGVHVHSGAKNPTILKMMAVSGRGMLSGELKKEVQLVEPLNKTVKELRDLLGRYSKITSLEEAKKVYTEENKSDLKMADMSPEERTRIYHAIASLIKEAEGAAFT